MNKGEKKMAAAIILIAIVVAGLAWYYGLIPDIMPQQRVQPVDYTASEQDKANYKLGIGRFNLLESFVDSQDIGTARTSGTNYQVLWYSRQGLNWIYHDTGNDKYATLTPADNGYLWIVVKIPSGQAFYVDYQKIMTNNQYCRTYLYQDMDEDGDKEFCFQYDMQDHPIPNSGYPAISFKGFIITYDSSFTGLNDLANETAIGTSTVIKYKSYYLAFSAAKRGVAIYKIEFKITTTDETKIRLDKLEVPGLGYLDGSAFTQTFTASDIRYTYTVTTNFDNAIYLTHGANANNEYDMTLAIECTLASADDILCTLTVYYLVGQTEAGTSTNDTFYAQES
jgi:hypothetical protein